ncbi:MAG: hypothetical protein PVH24_07745 [Candidatus Zixiibacteriota bacterium]|jgi:hypothetical protein
MHCAYCSEKIIGKPIKQGAEYFCSLECANLASGIDPEEEDYYEEDLLEELFEPDE